MPCGHERTISFIEKGVDRRRRIMLKRSLGQNTDGYCWKDRQVPKLGSNNSNSEQRCIVLTFFAIDLDVYQKLAPLLSPLQGADQRNHLKSGAAQDMNGLEPLPPQPTIISQVDLENEQNLPMLEQTSSAKPFTYCNSFRGNVLGQTQNGKTWVESLGSSSSTFLPCYLVSDKSSTSVCNGRAVDSDFLAVGFPKTEKTAKRSTRKKGKKKRKQYRRATRQNDCAASPCEENINDCSPFNTSHNNGLTCLQDHATDQPLENTPSSPSIRESSGERGDSENNNEYVDCSTPLISCTSSSDAMDDSEPIESSQVLLSDCSEKCRDVQPMQKNDKHYLSCNSLDNSNTTVTDSFLDGWNSDISGIFSDDVDISLNIKSESGSNHMECGVFADSSNLGEPYQEAAVSLCGAHTEESNSCDLSNSRWLKDVTGNCDSIERSQCRSEACCSNGFQPVISGKRGRRARNRTIHGGTGKDNGISFWQKVQKLDRDECICKPRYVSDASQAKVSSIESKTKMRSDQPIRSKRNHSEKASKHPCSDETIKRDPGKGSNGVVNSSEISSSTVTEKTQVTATNTKLSKQAAIHQTKRGYYTAKNNITEASKNQVQRNEDCPKCELIQTCRSFPEQALLKQSQNVDQNQSEEKQKLDVDIETMTQGTCSMGCDVYTEAACSEATTTAQQDCGDKPEDLFLAGVEGNDRIKLKTQISLLECNKLDSSVGPVMQKLVTVGKNDKTISDMFRLESSNASSVEQFIPNDHNFDKNEAEVLSSDISVTEPSTGDVLLFPMPIPWNGISPCPGDDKSNIKGKVQPHSSDMLVDEQNSKAKRKSLPRSIGEFQADESKDHCFVNPDNDLDNIRKAVNDSYKAQIAVEGIQSVNGSALADCERFIYCASPVICDIPCIKSCNYCPQHIWGGSSLCWHQTPNIALKGIWQWYEEPGCYGLEVKAKDFHNSRRFCNNRSEFNAYFVPYLSAVQLFGRSKATRHDNCNEEPATFVNRSKALPYIHASPIFSMLLPQPHIQREKHLVESSCFNRDNQPSDDGKLIFEYFESEQPPWRRPLFEKIKELVNEGKPSNGQIYGDPQKLECLNLLDLHPASWYCVAWYPIYRIPDGNFHTAFLTYHSLGHLVHQSFSLDDAGSKRIVCPVVGLQTYNDKGKWWFQMRDPETKIVSSAEAPYSNPSEILRERLRTLNHAAAVMARAKVPKNSQASRNSHPDFEFFVSRNW